ncbi:MAG: carbon-nitrogen hydrolase family protein [Burkholderiaceae bacterium]|nr:carbon-nitrogen hydrolase family protein [Burkholderiaceae bacterium]
MKIAAVQMCSSPVPADNLARAAALVAEAAAQGAELVALPEYFGLMGRRDADKLVHTEMPGQGPMQDALARLARQHGLWLVGGTLPLKLSDDDRHVTNSCLVWGPDGQVAARYDKIHLFRFDDGERRYDEAATLCAGPAAPVAFTLHGRDGVALRVGLSICYDLRFPELFRALMQPPCDLFVLPAAFTYPTGQAHWSLLLRARAVENQCYLLASAQGGTHENGRRTWGHSLVADPWGEVLAVQPEGEGVVCADLDPARIAAVRRQLPALTHRRL